MVHIKILLFGRTSPFHCASHVAAIVTDLQSNQSLKVHYPFSTNGWAIDNMGASIYGRAKDNCCMSVIHLYSDQDFASFVNQYNQRSTQPFGWFGNNCADQVNFVLDYFFPNQTPVNELYKLYQSIFGITCILTLGMCCCLPAFPCISTPRDVNNKAWWLSFIYGHPPLNPAPVVNPAPLLPVTAAANEGTKPVAEDPVEYLAVKWGLI